MKLTRSLLALALSFSLSLFSFVALPFATVTAQEATAALQRGYRTGYSDGYMAGYRDIIDSATKEFGRHKEYTDADRAYNKDYGSMEDYRDGYRQGFERGYDTGFEKQTFDSAVPTGLTRRGEIATLTTTTVEQTAVEPPPAAPVEKVTTEPATTPIEAVTETTT